MRDTMRNVWIVIPAFNEELTIAEVIKQIISEGFDNIIVIDDGSSDKTYEKAREAGVVVISHRLNRGKGAATKTGMEAAKLMGAEIAVTLDADGQHEARDINDLVKPIVAGECEVVLGTRLGEINRIPWHRLVGNHVGNFVTWTFYGLWVNDSQSGFRAYSKKALSYINTTGDEYEFESEIIREIKIHSLRYKEVPIKVNYTSYSMQKPHGQGMVSGFKTLYKILWKVISF